MKTILLVDDDSFIRQLLAKLFQKNGFSVAEADGVWSAKQFLETDQAELVCSDLNMQLELTTAPAWRRVRTTSCSFPISLYSSLGEFISTL